MKGAKKRSMNKILTLTAAVLFATSVSAADQKEAAKANKPVFTIVKENPITSIKDQHRSGTCWDYSTLSFFEAEILKKTGKTYDPVSYTHLTLPTICSV